MACSPQVRLLKRCLAVIFTGKVLGIDDGITFHGATVKELRADFEAAINHYLIMCRTELLDSLKKVSGKGGIQKV